MVFPVIEGLNHVTLSVRSLERSLAFYEGILGCPMLARWPRGAYLLAGDLWVALLVDPETRRGPLPEYTHLAFSVAPGRFAEACGRILDGGAEVWQENRSEGDSLYFLDPDGHKLEIHATDLASRLQSMRDRPWEGLEKLPPAEESLR